MKSYLGYVRPSLTTHPSLGLAVYGHKNHLRIQTEIKGTGSVPEYPVCPDTGVGRAVRTHL